MSTAELLTDSLPVRKDSIEELVGHRNRALELFKQAVVLLGEAEQAAQRAAPFESHAGFIREVMDKHGYTIAHLHRDDRGRMPEVLDAARLRCDMFAWTSLQRLSGLRNLMDAKATKEFAEQVSKEPPPFTAENITATYMALATDAPGIFERGLVNVFQQLNVREYKTNSAFRIGKRVVLTHVLGTFHRGWNHWTDGRERIADLDRVFHILDGKKPPETANAADTIEHAYNQGEAAADTPYFSARLFAGNKNIHLTFKRLDLVNKANDIIARHFGTTLPDDSKAA